MDHWELVEGSGMFRCLILGHATERAVRLGYIPGYSDNVEYVSAKACEHLARAIGWTSPEKGEELRAQVAELEAEVARATGIVAKGGVDGRLVELAIEAGEHLAGFYAASAEIATLNGGAAPAVAAAEGNATDSAHEED